MPNYEPQYKQSHDRAIMLRSQIIERLGRPLSATEYRRLARIIGGATACGVENERTINEAVSALRDGTKPPWGD